MNKTKATLRRFDIKQVTLEGYREIEAKLARLTEERKQVRLHLQELREQQASDGYDRFDMVSSLNSINNEIDELTSLLKQVVVIDTPKKHRVAQIGAVIHLQDGVKTLRYQLVDSVEADPSNGKISSDSPLGRALLGKGLHQLVHFVSPKLGILKYKITGVK